MRGIILLKDYRKMLYFCKIFKKEMFNNLSIIVLTCWLIGLILFYLTRKNKRLFIIGNILINLGIIIFFSYIIYFWILLERPPLRTLGETRLWYSFFLSLIGMVLYYRWKILWMPLYSLFLSAIFIIVNYLNPDYFDKTLMPALQSPYFVPHVIVYLFAYAVLGATALISLREIYMFGKDKFSLKNLYLADNLVYIGFSFLTFGLLLGALWAKEAWGSYWTWDPKETWAMVSWLFYLLYIHYRAHKAQNFQTALWILALAFVFLIICWFGINYLPTANNSVHTYSN